MKNLEIQGLQEIVQRIKQPEGRVNFVNVFHLHQPEGQFEHIFEEAYNKSYNPLISALERHPLLKTGIHITGPLLKWFEDTKTDFIKRIRVLVERGQVEMIGGGYYEPILAVIPDRDKLAQIIKLSDELERLFKIRPKGMWLAERAWEPSLVSIISKAEIEYIFIDDNHIKSAGIFEPEIHHTFVTEDQGESLQIFPINEPIRYIIPWKKPEEIFDYLSEQIDLSKINDDQFDQSLLITNIDDAEKLGMWPGTFKQCYESENGGLPWIDQWFGLTESLDWVTSILPSEYIGNYPDQEIVYLPTTSYDKMGIWVLATPSRRELEKFINFAKKDKLADVDGFSVNQATLRYAKGGYWRQFMMKYPEANLMHKRMLFTHKRLRGLEKKLRKDDYEIAEDFLLKAQCNDAYWHGQFGGVYYFFMRNNVYKNLISADRLLYPKLDSDTTKILDYDFDGKKEIIMESETLILFISPHKSFSFKEIDYKVKPCNIVSTFTRKEESYHPIDPKPVYDLWNKFSFIEFQLVVNSDSTNLINFIESQREELVSLISYQPEPHVNFDTILTVGGVSEVVRKEIKLSSSSASFEVSYDSITTEFITEINLTLDDAPGNIEFDFGSIKQVGVPPHPTQIFVDTKNDRGQLKIRCKNPSQPEITIDYPKGIKYSILSAITSLSYEEGNWKEVFQGFSLHFLLCTSPVEKRFKVHLD